MYTALAIEDAASADPKRFCQSTPSSIVFCGTTATSPGRKTPLKDPPTDKFSFVPTTEPSARFTKILFLLAKLRGPPEWPRYDFALLPAR
jgi:hypothetical protein